MAQVSLILLDDVEKLGLAGDEVHVAPGYARNYLIPYRTTLEVCSLRDNIFIQFCL